MLVASPARAGSLGVEFQRKPIFNQFNFVPGNSTTSWVEVTNNYNEEKGVGIAGEVKQESVLADALHIEVSKGGEVLYGKDNSKSLTNFFNDSPSGIFLSNINPDETQKYNITVTFVGSEAENVHQNEDLTFDFTIGFFAGETISEQQGGGGGSTGGYYAPPGNDFDIKNISHALDTEGGTDIAIITWDTYKEDTNNLMDTEGAIVYGESSVDSLENKSPPNYGYDERVYDESGEVSEHSVKIADLDPDTYYYRVVGWNSPEEVSSEGTFTILETGVSSEEISTENGEEASEGEVGVPEETGTPEEGGLAEETTGGTAESEEPLEEETESSEELTGPTTEEEEEPDTGLGLASLLEGMELFGCLSCIPWWVILVFAIFSLVRAYSGLKDYWKGRGVALQRHYKNKAISWLSSAIVLAVLTFIYSGSCLPIWLFVLLSVLTIAGLEADSRVTVKRIKSIGRLKGDFELISKTKILIAMLLIVAAFIAEWLILGCITLILIPLYFVGLALLDIREWRIHHEEQY